MHYDPACHGDIGQNLMPGAYHASPRPLLHRRAVLAAAASGLLLPGRLHAQPGGFELSYVAGFHDSAGRFAGGTEMRLLAAHAGKLYAGNGYWEDQPGFEGRHGAQILVLDAPDAVWRVDHGFADRLFNGRPRDLAVGALAEAVFTTDGTGRPLPRPAALLLASTWDLTGAARVFTRDDRTGTWSSVTLAQDQPARDFLPQIRSFGTHRDGVTGVDLVFAGDMPRGIVAGHYDPAAPGRIRWADRPELDASGVRAGFPGLQGRLRVNGFAEANGRLCAAVGQQVYQRQDGPAPAWRLIYTNPHPGHSETGLRGLTAIPGPDGDVLLAAVEGSAARMVRIDPARGSETTELWYGPFLTRAWGMRAGYTMAAYNDMTRVSVPGQGQALLLGLCAFIPRNVPIAAGHGVRDVGYGQVESGAWYMVRWPDARYELRQITAGFPQPPVAVRSICASPFAGDATVYFAGFDANKAPAHNTAWIARAPLAAAA